MNEVSELQTESPRAPGTSEREAVLEERIRKLEAALAAQSAPTVTEDEVTEKVLARLSSIAGGARSVADRVLVYAGDGTQQIPLPPLPDGAVLHPPSGPVPEMAHRRWFFTQLWAEIRLVFRMYFDPHYRVSRTTQFALPGIVLLLVFDYFFFSVWVSIAFVRFTRHRAK